MKKTTYLALFLANLAFGATAIKSVNFEGLKQISPLVAQNISGLKIGDTITGYNTNKAITNLFNQGYFDDVYITENNGNLIVHVKEKPIISKLDIEGVVTNDRTAMEQIIGLKLGQTYDKVALNQVKERVRQFYEVKGYFDTVVEIEEEFLDEDKSSLHLTVIVNRGEKITIKNVNLVGAKKLKYSDIRPAIANKQRETFGWMWGFDDGKLKTADLPNDPARIQNEYMKRGYLNATVSAPFVNTYMSNYTADLTYYITEGERFKVSEISIEAPQYLELDTKKIIKDLKLRSGKRFNADWIRRDIAKLENIVADKGYAYVEVNPDLKPDNENNTVKINYIIKPHAQIYVRNVTISGNEKTADSVVRREMYLTEGELYNRTDLVDSKNSLRRTGYFDDVEITENVVNDNEIDLNIDVKEAPTGSITGGIGYGSGDGLLLSASVSEKNIFGSGISGYVSAEKSDDQLSGAIGFTNPRIYNSEYSLSGQIYARDWDWNDYDEKAYGASATIGRKLGRYTNAYLTYEIEKSKINGLNAYYKKAGYQNGNNLKSSLIPSIVFNNTDDYYLPRSGIIASASLDYSGLGGDIEYLKGNANFNWYFGMKDYIDWDLIFRYKAGAGYFFDDKNLPVNKKLFLGGMRSVRGYDGRSIPKKKICLDNTHCNYIETGGKQSFNNSFELSMPLIDRINMRFVTFFDYGMIGDDSWSESKRYSTGAGIEWRTPVGPLQLFWVKPLNKEDYDSTNSFEFTIGARF
ncbi:outer membrane protein assembly factor BamA [Campylobacter ureolyticus]|uniref:Outer membrane protein assembly factor BamA n=1 Tax=Campylobacter ureolyticus TaxID=827 RepID=A0AAE7JNP5_9BACT|nr:outer membrane protein assembly factor BamA [Campylobacter ureolyticus]MCR8684170.1 outer membrane protein assembly factor BamA [Campylobacter ureolyticus]QKF83783.1 beta-barrel assembly machinery complex, BamA/YaeT protein [Campylobacter ureolyticus]QQY36062.1 outer membrane protein assembly factor BamA [Campylobacter ureolyticus]